ncbi:MAG: UUP1 family membrane protein, partial [Pseudomonadota bacterium]
MSSALHTRLLAFLLIVAGLGIFADKALRHDRPLTPGQTRTVWDFEIYLEFTARNRPVRIETQIPARAEGRGVSEEQFFNGPFGLRLDQGGAFGNRKAIWTYRYPNNRKVLRYRARLLAEGAATPLPEQMQQSRRRSEPVFETELERQAYLVWISDLRRRSADDDSLAERIKEAIFTNSPTDEVRALLPSLPRPLAQLELARRTLESQGFPARVANGVYLEGPRRRAEMRHWLEYHVNGADRRHFPGGAPRAFFALWYGLDQGITAQGAVDLDVQYGLRPSRAAAETMFNPGGAADSALLALFSFDDLPITTQLVYQVLVTIPVGILILVFLRQFVGLQTLGTFMPVLIGIAFRETALVTGLSLFVLLVALGLALRFYLERLKLLLVPRLAVVLVFIVLCMAGFTILAEGEAQNIGLSISLFPMVILTMTIERMSIVWEEYSPTDAVRQGLGSLAV